MRFDRLAEHQIRKAEAEGRMKNLKGAGKPLPRNAAGKLLKKQIKEEYATLAKV